MKLPWAVALVVAAGACACPARAQAPPPAASSPQGVAAQAPPPAAAAAQREATAPAAPQRDAPAAVAGNGIVRGRVTVAATGRPLHRVRLTLRGPIRNPANAVSDGRGQYEFRNLPHGSYTLTAARGGYLTTHYGQRLPGQPGRRILVEDDDPVEDVDIAMTRGAVLAGRIADDLGEPLVGARVEAMEQRYIRGRRVAVPARIATTNDEGEYRLSGLEAGSYQVRASSTALWEADDGSAALTFATTYFPGVAAADRPPGVRATAGQQVGGLDFRMLTGRAARVFGVVQGPNGEPLSGEVVYVSPIGRTIGGQLLSSGQGPQVRTDANGSFDFSKLAPGEYGVYTAGATDRAAATVVLEDRETRRVALTPRRSANVSGTVVTEEESPGVALSTVEVVPVLLDPARALQLWDDARPASVKGDGSFQVRRLDGEYVFRLDGLPDPWMLRAVTLGGREVTDSPLHVAPGDADIQALRVVISRKGARVQGEVVDAAGAPAPDSTVIVFAADRGRWGVASRFIRGVRPDRRGRFTVAGLPPGAYRIAAREDVVEGQWEDPEFLDRLVETAMRIELAESASETVTLTLERAR